MILLPAIDLYEGKVVRLTRGDYSRMTVYREDPLDQAREFEIAGAAWLHTVDLKDGAIAIKGWRETAPEPAEAFFQRLVDWGVRTVICTDVSRDGMLGGTNVALYQSLAERLPLQLIASGGVSSLEELRRLKALGLYGAILGKALYTGALSLRDALGEVE